MPRCGLLPRLIMLQAEKRGALGARLSCTARAELAGSMLADLARVCTPDALLTGQTSAGSKSCGSASQAAKASIIVVAVTSELAVRDACSHAARRGPCKFLTTRVGARVVLAPAAWAEVDAPPAAKTPFGDGRSAGA